MRRSWLSKGTCTSRSTTTTSANFTALRPSETESFSSFSWTLAFLRIPAVSKMRNGVPIQSSVTAIASRVIPASGPVSRRSSPRMALTSVDLPAFGRPTTAIWIGRPAGSAAPSPSSSTLSSTGWPPSTSTISDAPGNPAAIGSSACRRSSMPSPCSAESATGSPSPSSQASISPASAARPSALLATRITRAARLRSSSVSVRSTGVTPARASIMNRQTSAASIARSVSARIRPGRLASVASSRPAVSIAVKRSGPSRPAPSRRSRVTPGWSSTSASRRPTRRLKSVDLPTFGRPTMATVKDMARRLPGSAPPPRPGAPSP